MSAAPATFTLAPGMAPAAPLMRLLAMFDREKVEAFAEISIALLDLMDGDPDLEDNGDAEPDDDAKGDVAYVEWHTKPANLRRNGQPEIIPTWNEDDEDDDPAGLRDEDGVNTGGEPSFGWGGPSGPGCPIADPGGCEHDGREPEDGY